MKPTTEAEEKEIMEALESGAIQIEKPSHKLLSNLKRASENTFKKDRRINAWNTEEGAPERAPVSSAHFRLDPPVC
jgi:hypothetical protein